MSGYQSHHSHDSIPDGFRRYLSSKHKRFFHYTDSASALSMLKRYNEKDDIEANSSTEWKATYSKLWATHFCYLNDNKELISGLESFLFALDEHRATRNVSADVLKNVRKDVIDFIQSIQSKTCVRNMAYYPLSFCEEGNLLSQWKWYGKDGGVAIEYDLNNCLFRGSEMYDCNNPSEGILYDILYKPSEHKRLFKEYINNRSDFWADESIYDRILEEVCILSLFMKDKSFKEEKESRLLFVVTLPTNPDNLKPILNFRKKGNIIVPYIEAKIHTKTYTPAPIKSITVGPGENQNLVYEAFYQYILCSYPNVDSSGEGREKVESGCNCIRVHGIDLRRSLTPFRG